MRTERFPESTRSGNLSAEVARSSTTDLDTRIMDLLRNESSISHPLKCPEIAERLVMPERTVRDHLERLEKRGEVEPTLRRNDKKPGYVAANQYKEWEQQKYEVRKAHSDDLKAVLEEWIQQLPHVTWDEKGRGDIIHVGRIVGENYLGKKLQVEINKYLFADLEHHMDPTVFEHWNRMKDLATKVSKPELNSKELAANLKEFETVRGVVLRSLRKAYATPVLPGVCEYLDG